MAKIQRIWLRWTVRVVVSVAALVVVVLAAGSGYVWYRIDNALKPTGYKPERPLLSYATEQAPVTPVKHAVAAIDWNTITTPPRTAMPWVRWWWPGADVNAGELRTELQQLHDANFGGAEVQPFDVGTSEPENADAALRARVHSVDTPHYFELLHGVLDDAGQLGLQIDLSHYSAWPGASPGVSAEDGMLTVAWTDVRFGGAKHVEIDIPRPIPRTDALFLGAIKAFGHIPLVEFDPGKATLMSAVVAHPMGGSDRFVTFSGPLQLDPSSIQVIDAHIQNGKFTWDAPPGKWVLVAAWIMPEGQQSVSGAFPGPGYVANMLDSQIVRAEYNYAYGQRTGLQNYYGKGTLRAIFNDSLELTQDRFGSTDILEQFKRRRGYDLRPFLPVIHVDGSNDTYLGMLLNPRPRFRISDLDPRIRYDYELTISDLMIERFFDLSQQWAQQRGLVSRAQPYGADIDVIRAEGDSGIPETEQLESAGYSTFLRAASSGGMFYGRNIISAESLGWPGAEYTTNAAKMKASADLLFLSGVNQLVYHGFPYNWTPGGQGRWFGPEGWEAFTGNSNKAFSFAENYSARVPLWQDMKDVNTYVGRAQSLLRQGRQTADVLIYYPYLGLAVPNRKPGDPARPLLDGEFPLTDPATGVKTLSTPAGKTDERAIWLTRIMPLLDALDRRGLTWEWVNGDCLRNQLLPGGRTRSGAPYGAVVFAENLAAAPEDLAAAQKLAGAGVPVFIYGQSPVRQLGYLNAGSGDAEVRALAADLSSRRPAPNSPSGLVDAIIAAVSPSFAFAAATDLRHEGRALDKGWVDFVANEYDQPRNTLIQANGTGPIWWFDAMSGAVWPAQRDAHGNVALELRPYESRFLIRGIPVPSKLAQSAASILMAMHSSGRAWPLANWELTVGKEQRQGQLFDWRGDKALRYSGDTGIYRATLEKFNPRTDARYVLHAGLVPGTAKIQINGNDAGRASLPPGDLDITPFLHVGSNAIEIDYQPAPRNALIGAAINGDKRRAYMRSRKKELVPAGLQGPISVSELIPSTRKRVF